MPMRVVVAEDHYLMRAGLLSALELIPGVEVAASCASYDELLAAIDAVEPDLVLTDIRMPPSQTDEGIRAAQLLRDRRPQAGVIVLSQHVEAAYAVRLFRDGSQGRGYLLKERVGDLDELSAAVRTVADGGSVVDPAVVESLVGGTDRAAPSALGRLTQREREVLSTMATGASNAAIGERLFISPRSVEKHISSIFTKLDLEQSDETHRRVRAVLIHLGDAAT
ncbi:MAG: response regulator transcription factor [Acidimicrobiales bacterium]|nr:response regulator transcription factor [Acidimicrobiales bacterium]